MLPRHMLLGRILAVSILSLAVSTIASAQSGRGNISGTVRDASGASIPSAKVTVVNSATNEQYDLTTNDKGDYTAVDLPVGTYSVLVQKQGFSQSEMKGLTVNAAASVRAD